VSSNVNVKKVKLKVLEIQQVAGGEPEPPVDVDLRYVEPPLGGVGGVPIFQGEMIYWDPNKKKCAVVDLVDAVFPAYAENVEPGNIKLQITLRGENTFIEGRPPVTTVPGDDSTVPTHCVEISPSISGSDETMVTVTFIEPAPGEFVAYPALYFNTTEGIIDPGISVRRRTGD